MIEKFFMKIVFAVKQNMFYFVARYAGHFPYVSASSGVTRVGVTLYFSSKSDDLFSIVTTHTLSALQVIVYLSSVFS